MFRLRGTLRRISSGGGVNPFRGWKFALPFTLSFEGMKVTFGSGTNTINQGDPFTLELDGMEVTSASGATNVAGVTGVAFTAEFDGFTINCASGTNTYNPPVYQSTPFTIEFDGAEITCLDGEYTASGNPGFTETFSGGDSALNGVTTTTGSLTWTADAGFNVVSGEMVVGTGNTALNASLDPGILDYTLTYYLRIEQQATLNSGIFIVKYIDESNYVSVNVRLDSGGGMVIRIYERMAANSVQVAQSPLLSIADFTAGATVVVEVAGRSMTVYPQEETSASISHTMDAIFDAVTVIDIKPHALWPGTVYFDNLSMTTAAQVTSTVFEIDFDGMEITCQDGTVNNNIYFSGNILLEFSGMTVNAASGTTSGQLLPPTNFSLTNPTQTTMDASWTAPSQGSATGFRVKSGTNTVASTSWGTTSATIQSLSSGQQYTMHVVTTDGTLESAPSNTDTLSTNPGAVTAPPDYTRFLTFSNTMDGSSLGTTAVDKWYGNTDPDNFDDGGAISQSVCVYDNANTFNGLSRSAKLSVSGGSLGGEPAVIVDGGSAASTLPIGTKIYYQVRVVPNSLCADALNQSGFFGSKFIRTKCPPLDFFGFYPYTKSGAPSGYPMKMDIDGVTERAVMRAPLAQNNGALIANQVNTYELYIEVGDTPSNSELRFWKDHHPCDGLLITYPGPVYTPNTNGGGYSFRLPITIAGGGINTYFHNQGTWNIGQYSPPSGALIWWSAIVSLVNPTANELSRMKTDSNGFKFLGPWENG